MEGVLDVIDGDQVHTEQELPGPETIEKRLKIVNACEACDKELLSSLATSKGGLVDDDLRKIAWPILLGYDGCEKEAHASDWRDYASHRDEHQVDLDVNRSFVYYPKGQTELELTQRKEELSLLIRTVLRRYPSLCYFQGYHDIAQVLLLVLEPALALPALERVSLFRIRDYMLPSITPALNHLHLITEILYRHDKQLCHRVSHTQPYFALAATLTLYAHDIEQYSDIVRLFDFILSHEPVVTIYLYAAIITSRRKEILEIPESEPEMIHFTLLKLPNPLDLEGIIEQTMVLYKKFPPTSLPHNCWRRVPQNSVLKTGRDIFAATSCEQGVQLYEEQMRQLAREEWRKKSLQVIWKYRRPAGSVALTVMVGLLSYWMMKSDASGVPVWRRMCGLLHGGFWARVAP
ncbi:hypothetical protein KEM56_007341 [Ascosphaera pollenicola]|nr:hypothetical protein KEM56_007341 [Ascosphaera pollenicola]